MKCFRVEVNFILYAEVPQRFTCKEFKQRSGEACKMREHGRKRHFFGFVELFFAAICGKTIERNYCT